MSTPPTSLRVIPFKSRRHEAPPPADAARLVAHVRCESESILAELTEVWTTVDRLRGRVTALAKLAHAPRWDAQVGSVSYIDFISAEVYWRSRNAIAKVWMRSMPAIGSSGLLDGRICDMLLHKVVPTISHDDPFRVRICRLTGRLLEGPEQVTVHRYRGLRAIARREA